MKAKKSLKIKANFFALLSSILSTYNMVDSMLSRLHVSSHLVLITTHILQQNSAIDSFNELAI